MYTECFFELSECRGPDWRCPECGALFCAVHKCDPDESAPSCPLCREKAGGLAAPASTG